jgi:hypothetical protein
MAASLSPQLHADLTARLEQLLDQADDLRSAKASLGRALGAELWVVQSQIATVRAQLKGQDAPQLSIPGAEVGDHRADPVVARLLALAGKVREPAPAPAKAKAPPKKEPLDDLVGTREEAVKRHRARGEIVRWSADAQARRVPTFVIEQTGIFTKAGIIEKYGENATFEKGKPRPQDLKSKKAEAERRAAPKCAACGRSSKRPGGALTAGEGLCWDCHTERHPEQAKAAGGAP